MNRRFFLKAVASGLISSQLTDLDRLLWIPGEKTFFLPTIHAPSPSEIIALELERILPNIINIFEQDDLLYSSIVSHKNVEIIGAPIRVPTELRFVRMKNE